MREWHNARLASAVTKASNDAEKRLLAESRPDLFKSWAGGCNAILVRGQAVRDHRIRVLRRLPERRVAVLRCLDRPEGGSTVEALITSPDGDEPVRRGPYQFASASDAFRFLQEATLALQYLGCSIGTP